ncbi:hypothetical protein V8C40DRAFT_258757 [Trichoderma camerunense]
MAAQNNELYSKAGLDTVTDEEHEDLISTLSALADTDSADATGILADAPDSTPGSSIDNVFYINFNPKTETLSAPMKAKLESIVKNVNLSSGFFSTKANTTATEKINAGQIGKGDQLKQANYVAKVINYLVANAPWITTVGVQTQNKQFTVEKNQFHQSLVSHFTEGLSLPKTILDKLEGFLTNVKNVINKSVTTTDDVQFFIYIMLYVNDEVLQTWRPYVRTIYFKPTQSLSQYTKKKGDESSGVKVNIGFEYVQMDGAFNNDLFESSAKIALTSSQDQASVKFATRKEPLDIDV